MLSIYQFLLNKGLEKRRVQEKFFSIVLSAIEEGNNTVKLIQAPTGTGKTYGYLIPLMETGQKAIISTGTKLLQEQLRKDIESLRSVYSYLYGKDINYLILKGKSNYLCLDRYYELPPTQRPAELELAIGSSWDGDFEFVSLEPELKEKLSIDEDHCTPHYRNLCKYRNECYYWSRLKRMEQKADLLVINHALLSLKDFDAEDRVLVIDEAHELDKYLTSSLGMSLSLYTLRREIMGRVREFIPGADIELEEFFAKHFGGLFKGDKEEVPLESLKAYAEAFEREVVLPLRSFFKNIRESLISELTNFTTERMFVSLKFKDYLLKTGLIDWDRYLDLKANYEEPTQEEERLIKKLRDYEILSNKLRKAFDFAKVMKEDPQEFGYLVGRKFSKRLGTFNYYLEVFPVFPAGHVDFTGYRAVIATSATIDPEDMASCVGLRGEYYELEHGFDYSRVDFLVYMVEPRREREKWELCLKEGYRYLRSLYEKVLVLLTNKENIKLFEKEGDVAFQGEEPLSRLVQELREGKIKALIGLDSLWFGVDVKGPKGMLMAKLPFESPEDPITFHRIRFLKSIGENPFDYQKRKALIKFRQGIGRLIRSREDYGTIVLCDKRIFRFKEFLRAVQELGIRVRRTGSNFH